ncbi:MAG: hypothetical protein QXR84_09780 [Candidatus Bathyarchaeia archaeon]
MLMRSYVYRIVVLWALVLSLILFYQGVGGNVIGIDYFPSFPRLGEPVQITVRLVNSDPEPRLMSVRVYVDGLAVADWLAYIDGGSVKEYRVVGPSRFDVGGSIRVYAEALDVKSGAVYSRSAMVPPFPPEAFTSFISFASFSSTLMGYMTTLSYYTTTMAAITPAEGVNAGLILSLTLIGLLVFMELTDPAYGKMGERITHLRRNFTREAIILLIVFLAMVATKIIFIVYGV